MTEELRVGKINQLFDNNMCSNKISHIDYEGDPIAFWIAENKWKDKELKYLLKRLEMSEDENKCLRRKLYIREKK